MTNRLPSSIDIGRGDYPDENLEHVAGSGSRFLNTNAGQEKRGVVIDPNRINSAFTQEGYRLVATITPGGEQATSLKIVDMGDIISNNGMRDYCGKQVSDAARYIIVGNSADQNGDFEVLGLRDGDVFEYGRSKTDSAGNPRENTFATNQFTSRQQLTVRIDEQGTISIIDQNSSNGTTVEWGTNEAPKDVSDVEAANPRGKRVGAVSLKHNVALVIEELPTPTAPEAFINAEAALRQLRETVPKEDLNRVMAKIAEDVILQSDMPVERVTRDATELITDLQSIDPAIIDMLGIETDFAIAKDSLRRRDTEALKQTYATIVRKVGAETSRRSRWVEEKMTRDDKVSFDASLIDGIAPKYLRRAVNGANYVGPNRVPVMQYLKERIR